MKKTDSLIIDGNIEVSSVKKIIVKCQKTRIRVRDGPKISVKKYKKF